MTKHSRGALPVLLVGLGLLALTANTAQAGPFVQTNLVSNLPGLAPITDPNLINPWGVSESTTSPFWVSDQGETSPRSTP